jgi:lipoate-protein ligase B
MIIPSAAIEVRRISGLTPYSEGITLQERTRADVERGNTPNTLLLIEHTPVITLGRNADEKHLLQSRPAFEKMGIDVLEVDRGGDVTYHGPGQLVAYPIIDLVHWKKSVGWYLRQLEETLIRTLRQYDLKGERAEGMTGVWVGGAKIAAVGIGVRNWITYHGISLNVDPNMDHFNLIVPCGIANKPVTSLRNIMVKETPDMASVMDRYSTAFTESFAEPID